jgi:hypothetical protein
MPSSRKNREGIKNYDKESRTGSLPENRGNRKLSDNSENASDESISTRGDTSNGMYSRTKVRKEEKEKRDKGESL